MSGFLLRFVKGGFKFAVAGGCCLPRNDGSKMAIGRMETKHGQANLTSPLFLTKENAQNHE